MGWRTMRRLGRWVPMCTLLLGLTAWLYSGLVVRRVQEKPDAVWRIEPVGEHELHYRVIGQGPVLLALHGLSGNLNHFNWINWSVLADHRRIVFLDRPGNGLSHGPALSLEAQADLIVQWMDHLNIQQADVLGHSMGGTIAMILAVRHPSRFNQIMLVTPLLNPASETPAIFKPLSLCKYPLVFRLLSHAVLPALSSLGMASTTRQAFAPETPPSDFNELAETKLSVTPRALLAASSDFCSAQVTLPSYVPLWSAFNPRIHVLLAESDNILNSDQQAALLSSDPRMDIQRVPGGHMLPVTQPMLVQQWLDQRLQVR